MNWWIPISTLAGLALGLGVAFLLRRTPDADGSPASVSASRETTRPAPALELLEHMTDGVLVLDGSLHPVFANSASCTMLGIRPGPLPSHLPLPQVTDTARSALEEGASEDRLVEVAFPSRRGLQVRATPLEAGSRVMVVLRDVSEELRTQRIRKEFVAHASHELKSPVASLRALTEAVAQALEDDPAEAARFARRLLDESERLGKLVVDLLDLSRLEEPVEAPQEPCDLTAIAEAQVDAARERAELSELTLRSEIDPELHILGDEQQLGLLLRNLLDNAIQYTPAGGRIDLLVTRSDGHVTIRVSDTGIGIPGEAQPRVFERFYRVDRARSRARGGTGLGLAIVKHVAELHGGRVELHSEVGRGSTFEVRLPSDLTRQRESA